MWPPDAEPEPDPESARSGRTVPGLRALLPARAFLCSLKGRLLLAESVSARAPRGREARSPRPSPGPLPLPALECRVNLGHRPQTC